MELPDSEACYRAVKSRDPRFDGRLFVGVAAEDSVALRIPYRPPYDWAALLTFLEVRGVELVSEDVYRRTVAMDPHSVCRSAFVGGGCRPFPPAVRPLTCAAEPARATCLT